MKKVKVSTHFAVPCLKEAIKRVSLEDMKLSDQLAVITASPREFNTLELLDYLGALLDVNEGEYAYIVKQAVSTTLVRLTEIA